MRTLLVADLGRQPYEPVLELQRALVQARLRGELSDDLLLLVEHEPVVTLGRGTRPASLLLPRDELMRRGYEVHEVERGGDVTVHAPGQLVGYPILDLSAHRPDLHWYLRALESTLIKALATLDVVAGRRAGLTGVWVGRRKIASIGVHVKRWVTLHGFALNVTTEPSWFDVIVPCGIQNVEMTSVAREAAEQAGAPIPQPEAEGFAAALWSRARAAVIEAFGQVFERTPTPSEPMLAPGGLLRADHATPHRL